jgi:ABC-type dipeptide/oligopeptide/nickel transport system ATPase component
VVVAIARGSSLPQAEKGKGRRIKAVCDMLGNTLGGCGKLLRRKQLMEFGDARILIGHAAAGEPFGAVDAKTRKDLRRWLRDVHDRMGLTSVFITQDQEETLDLADRVVVMNQGAIEQIDSPEAVWTHPATAFVCDFLEAANRIACTARAGQIDIGGVLLANSAPEIGAGNR